MMDDEGAQNILIRDCSITNDEEEEDHYFMDSYLQATKKARPLTKLVIDLIMVLMANQREKH